MEAILKEGRKERGREGDARSRGSMTGGGGAAKWKSQIQWEGRKRKIESRTVGVRAEEMPNNGLS